MKSQGKQALMLAAVLFALNAFLCWRLFGIEYLDDLQSAEGVFVEIATFLKHHAPHVAWIPWFNAGTPLENAYFPGFPLLIAATSLLARCSPGRALHILAGLIYALGPVFLFLFARKSSGRLRPSFWAALTWSLFSPSLLIPRVLHDLGWGSRRLINLVYYGETPHQLALCLAPLALLLLLRYWDSPSGRRFAMFVFVAAAVTLSNAFGIVVLSVSSVLLWCVGQRRTGKQFLAIGAMLLTAYLLICRFLPPSLLLLLRTNSLIVGGDYRPTLAGTVVGVGFLLAMGGLWLLTRRMPDTTFRFSLLFLFFFGAIALLWYWKGISFVPQPDRYLAEAEVGFCLAAGFALDRLLARMPRRAAMATVTLCAIPLGAAAVADYRLALRLIRPLDLTHSLLAREARWIGTHLPGERVMLAGEIQFWFHLFAENPQLSGAHEASDPNRMQRVAAYAVYAGQATGALDGPLSVLWLKAFGCGGVTVPGAHSADHFHPIGNPAKFDGLLPLIWRDEDESIYRIPLPSSSLAHVIPRAAVVSRQPVLITDVEPLRPYIAALDDASLPPAALTWSDPEHGHIAARVAPGQVISLQMTYDRGWKAHVGERPVHIRRDQLGLMILEPNCSGACTIDLEFTGGWERRICLAISVITALALFFYVLLPDRTLRRTDPSSAK